MKQKPHKNQTRKPKQARAKQKYEAILDACTQVLAEKGYQKTTILELSLESGVAVPTLYQYFENKDAIFVAWVERIIDQVLTQVASLEASLATKNTEQHVSVLLTGALSAVNTYRKSMQQLLSSVPQTISSQIIASLESKTLNMLQTIYAPQLKQLEQQQTLFQLSILIRLITGYFIQTVLNAERSVELEIEAKELTLIVTLYLAHHKISLRTPQPNN